MSVSYMLMYVYMFVFMYVCNVCALVCGCLLYCSVAIYVSAHVYVRCVCSRIVLCECSDTGVPKHTAAALNENEGVKMAFHVSLNNSGYSGSSET